MADLITFRAFERPGLYRLAGPAAASGRPAGRVELEARDLFGGAPQTRPINFEIAGPADVEGLEPGAVLRTAPRSETSGAETTKAVHVEFAAPDLPWRYSPVPLAGLPLQPWLVVIVGTRDELSVQDGFIVTASNQVWIDHDLSQSARWAHVQDDGNGNVVGRVFSPRPLQPQREHLAAVVQAFVYDPDSQKLVPAWQGAPPASPLPALYSWRFWTAEAGDFETLATDLRMVPTGDLGTANLVYTPQAGGELNLPVGGAITSLKSAWLQAAAQAELDAAAADLDALSRPQANDSLGRKVLGLPEYGSPWVERPEDTSWGNQLNDDPRLRGIAGLGLWMGLLEQEDLIDAAVQQLGEMGALRRVLRDLAFGLLSAQRLWDRRLPADPQAAAWLFGAALGRLPTAGGTVLSAVSGGDRPLPPAFFSSAARRTLRRSAPWIRRSPDGYLSRTALVDAGNACPPPPRRAPASLAHLDALTDYLRQMVDANLPSFEDLFGIHSLTPEELEMLLRELGDLIDQPVQQIEFAERIRDLLQNFGLVGDCNPIEEIQQALAPYEGQPTTADLLVYAIRSGVAGCGMDLHSDPADRLPGFVSGAGLTGVRDSCRPVQNWGGLAEAAGKAFNPHGENAAGLKRLRARVPWPTIQRPEPLEIPIGLDYPTWTLLNKHAPEWILPGVDKVEKNTVVALQSNPPFTEAFLVGINTQFQHELHWRGLPVDRTSTPLLMFWYPIQYALASRRAPDIRPIGEWRADTPLGHPSHQVVRPEDEAGRRDLIILFHSDLFRRYPSTLVYLVRIADGEDEKFWIEATPDFNATTRFSGPLFRGAVREDLVFFSFDVDPETLGDYWLVLDEPPAELRFRSDEYQRQAAVLPADGAGTAVAVIDRPSRVAFSGEELKKLGTLP